MNENGGKKKGGGGGEEKKEEMGIRKRNKNRRNQYRILGLDVSSLVELFFFFGFFKLFGNGYLSVVVIVLLIENLKSFCRYHGRHFVYVFLPMF